MQTAIMPRKTKGKPRLHPNASIAHRWTNSARTQCKCHQADSQFMQEKFQGRTLMDLSYQAKNVLNADTKLLDPQSHFKKTNL